jgi:hypothetical protein
VLILLRMHAVGMFGLIVIAFVLVVGPLALLYGVDSRTDDVARRRRFDG